MELAMIKIKLIGIVLGGLILLGGAAGANAAGLPAYPRDCARRVEHREFKLRQAERDHGFRSWQADRERRELDRARYECR